MPVRDGGKGVPLFSMKVAILCKKPDRCCCIRSWDVGVVVGCFWTKMGVIEREDASWPVRSIGLKILPFSVLVEVHSVSRLIVAGWLTETEFVLMLKGKELSASVKGPAFVNKVLTLEQGEISVSTVEDVDSAENE